MTTETVTASRSELAANVAAVMTFEDLMWMHTVALRRRAFANSRQVRDENDELVSIYCDAIAEHIVREEARFGIV